MISIKQIIRKYAIEEDDHNDVIKLDATAILAIETHINREYELIKKHKGNNTDNNYYMER